MSKISMRDMLEAGVHFGHQTRYWNPKMANYLFGQRNKIHIINLEQTMPLFEEALNFISKLSANRGTILFVGTKRAAQQIIEEEAKRCEMPYVNRRWLGGLLTNYKTVKQSINRLRELEEMQTDGSTERMSKKEVLTFKRELEKLERSLSGIKDMKGSPDAIFIIDVGYENIAVSEANKLNIPVVGVVDSNNSTNGVDYVIPGNDDAIRSIRLYAKAIADAIIEGRGSVSHIADVDSNDDFIEMDAEGNLVVDNSKKAKPASKKKTSKKVTKAAEKKADAETEPAEAASSEVVDSEAKTEVATASKKTTKKKTTKKKATKKTTDTAEKASSDADTE